MQPEPAPVPSSPATRTELAAEFTRILTGPYGPPEPALVTALVVVAVQYGAGMVERWARPDDRWGPKS
jgi:hypothetical protein